MDESVESCAFWVAKFFFEKTEYQIRFAEALNIGHPFSIHVHD
jgi:hypothetical protein